MDYEHYILQGEAKSTEFSDDRSYLLVQKANSYCACVGQTEECCLPKIVFTYDFGPLLYTCLDRCVLCATLKLVNWIVAVIAILFSNLRRYEDVKPGAG